MAGNDQAVCTQAANQEVSNHPPQAQQDCADVLHIAVFFDGTGNNKDADEATKKWSNVARMWRAASLMAPPGSNNKVIYISGVGTPFNGQPLFWLDRLDIRLEDSELGLGTGAGGTRRLNHGAQQVNDALRQALLARANQLGKQVQQYAKKGKQQSLSEVKRALDQHRLIRQINVSIFGFSRGAALARAFCNEWIWACSEKKGKLYYEDYPIRFKFLGLFDTVASFGLPSANVNNLSFRGRDMVVHKQVERCVHYVAAHELRFSFPVDLIRYKGKLDGRWREEVYPGVHSDIGGGYEPMEQGVDNNYARIPMRDMMREALRHGTRLYGYEHLKAKNPQIFQERFECRPETEAAYQAYRAVCNPGGSVEQKVRAHMAQLYSAYGTLNRAGQKNLTQRLHRQQDKSSLWRPGDMGKEVAGYEKLKRREKTGAHQVAATVLPAYRMQHGVRVMWVRPAKWQLDAWYAKAAQGVVQFVDRYVHDSKYGFLHNGEPFSYFSTRGIDESTHSVQGWFDESVRRPVGRAYDQAVDATNRGIEQGVSKAKEVGKSVGQEVDKAKKTGKQAYDKTVDAMSRGMEQGANKAKEVGQRVGRAYDQAVDATSRGIEQGVNKAKEVGKSVGQGMDKMGQSMNKAVQDASKTLQEAWDSLTK